MNNLMIRIENVSKRYRIGAHQTRYKTFRDSFTDLLRTPFKRFHSENAQYIWALHDLSLEIYEGEVLGIIGRNGAGKTTLLKIISRITRPTKGKIEIYGKVGSLLEIGTGFHPELTGRENIYLYGAILGMKKREIQNRFDEIVDFSGIEKFIDTPMKFYSNGMFVRLAFTIAAYLDTDILLVDEVLSVGDAEFQKKSMNKMSSISKSGRTILFVSHNMTAVQQLCDSCILLDEGKLVSHSHDVGSVIKNYIYTEEEELHSIWYNENNKYDFYWFTPIRMSITDKNGSPISGYVKNDSEVWVEIELLLKIIDPAFTIGYAIFNEDGICLYWSYHTDTPQNTWPLLTKGRIILKSKIPQNFLNEGLYRIEMIASLHFREWLLEPGKNTPNIFLRIQGGLSESPLWIMKRPGVVAPIIQWEIKHV